MGETVDQGECCNTAARHPELRTCNNMRAITMLSYPRTSTGRVVRRPSRTRRFSPSLALQKSSGQYSAAAASADEETCE